MAILPSLSLLLLCSPAALSSSTTDTLPLSLEWKGFENQFYWDGATAPAEPYFELRVTGESGVFAGTWVELSGRVWFGEDFFDGWWGNDRAFESFRRPPDPWDLRDEGYDVYGDDPADADVDMPPCVLSKHQYQYLLQKNRANGPWSSAAERKKVRKRSEPMLNAGSPALLTTRNWTLEYEHWNQKSKKYWEAIQGKSEVPTGISKDALIKQLILDQSPELTTSFFTTELWEEALAAGVNCQLQGITMVGNENNPEAYAGDDGNPGGFLGDWTYKGATSALPYMVSSYEAPPGLTYPTVMFPAPPLTPRYTNAGSSAMIEMRGLRKDTTAELSVNGGAMTMTVSLSAGLTVEDAVFSMPLALLPGDSVKVVEFNGPGGSYAIPPLHQTLFIIN